MTPPDTVSIHLRGEEVFDLLHEVEQLCMRAPICRRFVSGHWWSRRPLSFIVRWHMPVDTTFVAVTAIHTQSRAAKDAPSYLTIQCSGTDKRNKQQLWEQICDSVLRR